MPGDARECRRRAAHCVALANATKIETETQRLMALAATWARLADKIERSEAIVADSTITQDRQAKV
jgi:hypothetical protein